VTFRTRLVLVATAAVLVVVVIGSVATYVVAYDSLVGSLDVTLQQDARNLVSGNQNGNLPVIENTCGRAVGYCTQMVWADGQVHTGDTQVLPISPAVAQAAGSLGTGAQLQFSTHVGGIAVREIVYPLGGPYPYSNTSQPLQRLVMPLGGALQVTAPLTGVQEGLHRLAVALPLSSLSACARGRLMLRDATSLDLPIEPRGYDHFA